MRDGDDDAVSRVVLRSRESSADASYVRLGKAHTNDEPATVDAPSPEPEMSAGGAPPPSPPPPTLEDDYAQEPFTAGEDTSDGIALYTADHIREATRKDKITEAKGSVRVHAEQDIHGRSVAKHLLRGRRMVIVSGGADDEPGEGESIDIGGDEVRIENDDMLLSSKGNVYIKAHGDMHTKVPKTMITRVDGDEITRTSGHTTAFHFGDTSRYVRGSSQYVALGTTDTAIFGPRVWGGCGGGLNIRAGTHVLTCFGVGFLTRHQLRWNVWTVKLSATEGVVLRDHTFAEVKAMIEAEAAPVSVETAPTECETASSVTEASQLLVQM